MSIAESGLESYYVIFAVYDPPEADLSRKHEKFLGLILCFRHFVLS
jgi:hypothetical protein